MKRLLILAVVAAALPASAVCPTYDHQRSYNGGQYVLSWSVCGPDLYVQIDALTTGWAALGIMPTPLGHSNADMIVGYVKAGSVQLNDYWSNLQDVPPLDTQQDLILLDGGEDAGHTILEFKRALLTGDIRDVAISDGGNYIAWALNPIDPASASNFNQHTSKGVDFINFFEGPDAGELADAGAIEDAGTVPDAGGANDAGTLEDAGTLPDAGTELDSGVPDAGGPSESTLDAGSAPPSSNAGGCGCSASAALTLSALAGLLVLLRLLTRRPTER